MKNLKNIDRYLEKILIENGMIYYISSIETSNWAKLVLNKLSENLGEELHLYFENNFYAGSGKVFDLRIPIEDNLYK